MYLTNQRHFFELFQGFKCFNFSYAGLVCGAVTAESGRVRNETENGEEMSVVLSGCSI